MTAEDVILSAPDAAMLARTYAAYLADVHPEDGAAVEPLRAAFRRRRRELGLLEAAPREAPPERAGLDADPRLASEESSPPSRWWWAVLGVAIYVLARVLIRMGRDG